MAFYIGLDEGPEKWAEKIMSTVEKCMKNRKGRSEEVKKAGFDSESEALRLQSFYFQRLDSESK